MVLDEVSNAPKRTFIEALFGVPILLLAVEPYREWIAGFSWSWWLIGSIAVVGFGYGIWSRHRESRTAASKLAVTLFHLHVIIEAQRRHTKEAHEGHQATGDDLRHSVALVLQALAQVAALVLDVRDSNRIHANLMVPMPVFVLGERDPKHGAGIVAYNADRPADRSWSRVAHGDLGAGEAFETGTIRVIEDTNDPYWCGLLSGGRAHSFVSLPITGGSGKVVAVVNLDSSIPRTFTRKNAVAQLYPVISGALSLLADILYSTCTRGQTSRRSLNQGD